jgi:hypothetical protein
LLRTIQQLATCGPTRGGIMIDLARLLGQITAAALVGLGIAIAAKKCGVRPKQAAVIGVVSGSSLFIETAIRVWCVGGPKSAQSRLLRVAGSTV